MAPTWQMNNSGFQAELKLGATKKNVESRYRNPTQKQIQQGTKRPQDAAFGVPPEFSQAQMKK